MAFGVTYKTGSSAETGFTSWQKGAESEASGLQWCLLETEQRILRDLKGTARGQLTAILNFALVVAYKPNSSDLGHSFLRLSEPNIPFDQ